MNEFFLSRKTSFSAAHFLRLNYDSPCARPHGHNWEVEISCKAPRLDENGMVCDFSRIKKLVKSALDHRFLNRDVEFFKTANPTAENIAKFLCDAVSQDLKSSGNDAICFRVVVQESPGSYAIYVSERGSVEEEGIGN